MLGKPLVLIILDGWGHREAPEHNAIAAAKTPNWDKIWREYPHCTLSASGRDVGLPEGQMGNSEVGHLTMGAGRRVDQDLTRISEVIKEGSFFQNPVFKAAFNKIITHNNHMATESNVTNMTNHRTLHILGLLSPGGVHSHEEHIFALIDYAKQTGVHEIALHCFLDGRDTPPQSAESSILALEKYCSTRVGVRIASVSGRYYAMDRDKRYDRTERVYKLLTEGRAEYYADTAIEALTQAYARGENDEFVAPTIVSNTNISKVPNPSLKQMVSGIIKDHDVVIFMNFRSDRARQLSYALTDPEFKGFQRHIVPKLVAFVTLTEYAADIKAEIAFPPLT